MKKLVTLLLIFIITSLSVQSQTYLFFQDSNDPIMWDCSWMELTSPSELERKGTELRKFPVETTVQAQQGINALRLKWKSVSSGSWFAIAAGNDWTARDISNTDTLSFWVFSASGQTKSTLPKVFFEDTDNNKSIMISLSIYGKEIPAQQWTNLQIPMAIFLNQVNPINYTNIKTIGFAQDVSDGVEHTLIIDNMRVFKGDGTSPAVGAPTGFSGVGYERHVLLQWKKNPESNVSGYQIERSSDAGASFAVSGISGKNDTVFSDYLTGFGTNKTIVYRLKALNDMGEPSLPSAAINVAVRDFTDDELLNMVQEATFRYFWDYAHPVSGLTRERLGSGETVTAGGSGFGLMAIIAGVNRGFITREQAVDRMIKIADFLATADRFHGAWPHWLNGSNGDVIPFSTKDNGGDLVETAFLIEGLLAARGYFDQNSYSEMNLRTKITSLWESVEWDWYRNNNSNVLYWHWSPNYGWAMNMPIRGYNEALIIYVLAIASPTHSVPATLYKTGWAAHANYVNGKTFYGHKIYVGWDYGGPLFFTHYSFLGFDPRNIKDQYTNYFNNSRNISLIHQAYCKANPRNFTGYSEDCWGLTASDDPDGYMAHEPTANGDNGTITPSAALSSMPYTPEAGIKALKHFYRQLGYKTWGIYGFYDAFNQKRNWYATSYLAIDQGPIIAMIENYRSGMIWDSFMKNPEIQPALTSMGFVSDPNGIIEGNNNQLNNISITPNPSDGLFTLQFNSLITGIIKIKVKNATGQFLLEKEYQCTSTGTHKVSFDMLQQPKGIYFVELVQKSETVIVKLLLTK
jgi:hypothetical protein